MLKSLQAIWYSLVVIAILALALVCVAFLEAPKPPPPKAIAPVQAAEAPVAPLAPSPESPSPPILPAVVVAPQPPARAPDPEPVVSLETEALEKLGPQPDDAANWTVDQLREFLEGLGLDVDPNDPEQSKRLDATLYKLRERLDEAGMDWSNRLAEVHLILEAQGRYIEGEAGESVSIGKVYDRPHVVTSAKMKSGKSRRYVVDSQEFPEMFEARQDRISAVALAFVSEAIAAVRERQ